MRFLKSVLKSVLLILAAATLFLSFSCAGAPPAPDIPVDADESASTARSSALLQLDPQVTYGTLENGLTYYVRRNTTPEERVELRLVVNAGSVLEREDQRGLAHFVEHMAFNGTSAYEKQAIIDYLEKSGMSFGPDINATTSFDRTIYQLDLPTRDPEVVNRGIDILKEWAFEIAFDPEEVEKERYVIIEEWRSGRSASSRMQDIYLPVLLRGSRYADRLPIGSMDVIRRTSAADLKEFYRSWYSPRNMAVIIVGDIDPDKMTELLRDAFGRYEAGDTPVRPSYSVPPAEESAYVPATDPEARNTRVQVVRLHDPFTLRTEKDFRTALVLSMYRQMINDRLAEKTEQADPPYVSGYFSVSDFLRNDGATMWGAAAREGREKQALRELLIEAERVDKYGFTAGELDRARENIRSWMKQAYEERDKTESGQLVNEYIAHFLSDEAAPGIEREWELTQRFLPNITMEEIQSIETKITRSSGEETYILTGPEKEGREYMTAAEIDQLLAEIRTAKIEPYRDEFGGEKLFDSALSPGAVYGEIEIPGGSYHGFTLSNGARIFYKLTDFKNEELLFSAFSPGGASLVEDDRYFAARLAPAIIDASGLADYSPSELKKLLTGKQVQVSPYIGELFEGFSGSSRPEDLELLFQLVHLYFTSVREDPQLFASYQQRLADLLENRDKDPQVKLGDEINRLLFENHPRRQPLTSEIVQNLAPAAVYDIFKQRFTSPSDFTFIFVGNVDPEQIRRLSALYLGSLAAMEQEQWQDRGVRYTDESQSTAVRSGIADKSSVVRLYPGDYTWDLRENTVLTGLRELLNIRLREKVREEAGGTYNVGVSISTSRYPEDDYLLTISFTCDPARVDELTYIIEEELRLLRQAPADASYLEKVRSILLKSLEDDRQTNRYWLSVISRIRQYEMDPQESLAEDERIRSLTAEDLQKAAAKYIGGAVEVEAVLYPEEFQPVSQ